MTILGEIEIARGKMIEETSKLDDFLFNIIKNQPVKILDFGCGQGRFVEYCRTRGLKIYGADTYEGVYEAWSTESKHIFKIQNNVVPVENHKFAI
jgi:2-polyprenyl-3-methyl-5-hydroxy-6-metoxy-1,4-benzoquinol methylase